MLRAFLRSAVCAVLVFTPKLAFSQSVVSTVYPVESLVKSIIHETPIKSDLLLKGPQSPHSYRLKPSDLRVLETADHIFWIGDNFETFLRTPFEKIAQKVPKTSLYQAVVKDTDEHHPSHDGHNEYQNDEEHEEHANAHIWLNPDQVIHSIEIITDVLSHQFPAYQTIFKTNKENFVHRLEDHLTEIKSRFSKLKSVPFIVYHDAYQGDNSQN